MLNLEIYACVCMRVCEYAFEDYWSLYCVGTLIRLLLLVIPLTAIGPGGHWLWIFVTSLAFSLPTVGGAPVLLRISHLSFCAHNGMSLSSQMCSLSWCLMYAHLRSVTQKTWYISTMGCVCIVASTVSVLMVTAVLETSTSQFYLSRKSNPSMKWSEIATSMLYTLPLISNLTSLMRWQDMYESCSAFVMLTCSLGLIVGCPSC